MNNHFNKKSSGHWARRLFEQAGGQKPRLRNKPYFAHLFKPSSESDPYRALFYASGRESMSFMPDSGDAASLAEHEAYLAGVTNKTSATRSDTGSSTPSDPDRKPDSANSLELTVLNIFDETPDTKTFRFGVANGRIFDYLPGQYLTLSTVIRGQEFRRSYSLASTPSRPSNLEITVKKVPGGVVSNWLHATLRIGDTVSARGPFGKFSCSLRASEKILLIAAGSGVVPIMSMLRWLSDTEARADIRLLLSFRTPDDIIYRDELNLIAARHKNTALAIALTTDAIDCYRWSGFTGRINETMLRQIAPDAPERTVYLCGPDAFMAHCKKLLLNLKLPSENLFFESFNVPASAGLPENLKAGLPRADKTGNYKVTFARSGITIDADGRLTLLELAERSGLRIDHECRSGHCGECMVKCLKGKAAMADEAEIGDFDRKKGWVYACCAFPASNIELDL